MLSFYQYWQFTSRKVSNIFSWFPTQTVRQITESIFGNGILHFEYNNTTLAHHAVRITATKSIQVSHTTFTLSYTLFISLCSVLLLFLRCLNRKLTLSRFLSSYMDMHRNNNNNRACNNSNISSKTIAAVSRYIAHFSFCESASLRAKNFEDVLQRFWFCFASNLSW